MRKFILLFSFICFQISAQPALSPNKIAIIIDDIGYRKTDQNALQLPANVTLSILPHTPYGQSLALKGYKKSHDIMLHIPMEATNGKFLGPGGLTHEMNRSLMHESLDKAYKEIPYAVGLNNHMGSLLTTLHQPMQWLMEFVKSEDLIFIDSITSSKSKATIAAKKVGIPTLARNIFLDNQLSHVYIEKQFDALINIAQKYKIAVAIAHPHPETIQSLLTLIPRLKKHNVELVSISTLIEHKKTL